MRGADSGSTGNLAEAIILTPMSLTEEEDRVIVRAQTRANAAEGNAEEAFSQLGSSLVSKARRTLDRGFYKLAEKAAGAMDSRFGVNAESRRGHALHNLHRFREAEVVARTLVAERGVAVDLALLSDALMELGKLAEAVEVLQRLVEVKPGVEAFSRIAHVR